MKYLMILSLLLAKTAIADHSETTPSYFEADVKTLVLYFSNEDAILNCRKQNKYFLITDKNENNDTISFSYFRNGQRNRLGKHAVYKSGEEKEIYSRLLERTNHKIFEKGDNCLTPQQIRLFNELSAQVKSTVQVPNRASSGGQ